MNSAGMEMIPPESISATQETVLTSWVERVTSAPVSIRPKALWLILIALRNTALRKLALNPATTSALHFRPNSCV